MGLLAVFEGGGTLAQPGGRIDRAGASLLLLRGKTRHKKLENVRRCFNPSAEAIAEVTSLLTP